MSGRISCPKRFLLSRMVERPPGTVIGFGVGLLISGIVKVPPPVGAELLLVELELAGDAAVPALALVAAFVALPDALVAAPELELLELLEPLVVVAELEPQAASRPLRTPAALSAPPV